MTCAVLAWLQTAQPNWPQNKPTPFRGLRSHDRKHTTHMVKRGGVWVRRAHGFLTEYFHLEGGEEGVVSGAPALFTLLLAAFSRVSLHAAPCQISGLLITYIPQQSVFWVGERISLAITVANGPNASLQNIWKTWGWVNDEIIFIFRCTIPLNTFFPTMLPFFMVN